jgi:hypothetical protein
MENVTFSRLGKTWVIRTDRGEHSEGETLLVKKRGGTYVKVELLDALVSVGDEDFWAFKNVRE